MDQDLIQIRNREETFLRNISKQYKNEDLDNRIIYHGIVEEVDRIGNDNRPKYSILTRLIGVDPSNSDFKAFRWYFSLFPIHLIAIPEIGEEILIILENSNDFSSGFWISRFDTKNKLTRSLVGENLIDDLGSEQKLRDKYGVDEDLKNKRDTDNEPNHEYNIPETRDKPGDVIIAGRSNTQITHSFDSETKKGYIEFSTEKDKVDDSIFYQDDFINNKGSRLILSTDSDLDKKIIEKNNLNFHTKYQGKNIKGPIAVLESEEIRFISRKGGVVNHAILGEIQEEFFNEAFTILKTYIDNIKTFVDDFITTEYNLHIHQSPIGPTLTTVTPGKSSIVKGSLDTASDKAKTDLDNLFKKVPNHRSKNIAIN